MKSIRPIAIPAAFVVLKPGEELDEKRLCAFLKDRIARFKMPRRVCFSQTPLPKTGTGQILKRDLREGLWTGKEARVQ